jgi:hypothetical protein
MDCYLGQRKQGVQFSDFKKKSSRYHGRMQTPDLEPLVGLEGDFTGNKKPQPTKG